MDPHPLDDYVEVVFAGRTWKLSLGLRAEVEFERKRGKDIGEVIAKHFPDAGDLSLKSAIKGFSAEDFCALVWCMAIRYHPEVGYEDFIDLISLKDLKRMFVEVMQAVKGFRGEAHPDDPPAEPQEKNGVPLDERQSGPVSGRFAASRSGSLEKRSRH